MSVGRTGMTDSEKKISIQEYIEIIPTEALVAIREQIDAKMSGVLELSFQDGRVATIMATVKKRYK